MPPKFTPLKIRHAAVAGSFYPAEPSTLNSTVEKLLQENWCHFKHQTHALIVPHAGYQYSGMIAAKAYSVLKQQSEKIERLVILGPSHRVAFHGLAIPSVEQFETPLGRLELDLETLAELKRLPGVVVSDEAHRYEHSLEVQLPFLQKSLGNVPIIPIVFSHVDEDAIAQVLDWLWAKPNTFILVSSDLSHFLDYQSAVKLDTATSRSIESLSYQQLDSHRACGSTAIKGLLKAAKQRQFQIATIAQCNSGDTAGDKSRVVGYASYAVY